jgi:hypothetical protein
MRRSLSTPSCLMAMTRTMSCLAALLLCSRVGLTQEAPATLGDALRSLPPATERASRGVRTQVIGLDSNDSAFLIPLAGNTPGLNGTYFRSDISIANYRSTAQKINVYWLSAGQNNCSASPALVTTLNANTIYSLNDFVGSQLRMSGVGAITIFGEYSTGGADTSSKIDGSARLWTPSPGTGGNTSMSFPPVSLLDSLGSLTAYALGLRQDSGYRTNVGVVNLDSLSHTWTVSVMGTNGSTTLMVTVPPCSMQQVAVPAGNYGNMFLSFKSDGSGFWWSAYAASVDNATGDGWVSHAAQ